ncbi:hypothetical protein [Bosea sp. (in: a-proteobacteria)]|uniref:hypothetical protein n=1 Tax=Bosea sp. (in: a-proteobacteria) TaxID=1871050 RepID=UPI002B47FA5D|nr:hypothetical protein [Bosea sp. (in: a-proteobacteria)]WRH59312.1 MAG: hypothetical protein RSE11_05895 [Bosea sp. (in: a-proteobacteria)]
MSKAMAAVRSIPSRLAALVSAEQSQIEALRSRIGELAEQRREVDAAPPSMAEIEARADELIDSCLDRAPPFFDLIGARGGLPSAGLIADAAARHPIAWAATLDRESLRRAMLRGQPDDGIDAADRAARLARLDDEIMQLCAAEELLLREVDAASGGHTRRRRDAPPAVLVAPTDELQRAASPAHMN